MKTQILQGSDLSLAIEALLKGEPVIFPTETVYGLGAPIFNRGAIQKIFTIKRRPIDNPLIAHIASLDEAYRIAEHFSPDFFTLAEAFWPGPLAMVVPKRKEVPEIATAGLMAIGIRMPLHPIARELIERVGEPLVAPSANLSGKPSGTRLIDVLEDLDGRVGYAIDGGACDIGIESSVISLIHDEPLLLRPGKITKEAIEEVLGKKVHLFDRDTPILSPGMKYRHYAPRAQIELIFQKEELHKGYLIPSAKSLYADLREADRENRSHIQIYCDEEVQKDFALMNRLLRASGQIV